MTFDDGMGWFDGGAEALDPAAAALSSVGSAARLSLYNTVLKALNGYGEGEAVSQKEMAARLRVSPQAVSRLLRQPSNMTIETAARLLFVLGRELRITSIAAGDPIPDGIDKWSIRRKAASSGAIFVDYTGSDSVRAMKISAYSIAGKNHVMIHGCDNHHDGVYSKVEPTATRRAIRTSDVNGTATPVSRTLTGSMLEGVS